MTPKQRRTSSFRAADSGDRWADSERHQVRPGERSDEGAQWTFLQRARCWYDGHPQVAVGDVIIIPQGVPAWMERDHRSRGLFSVRAGSEKSSARELFRIRISRSNRNAGLEPKCRQTAWLAKMKVGKGAQRVSTGLNRDGEACRVPSSRKTIGKPKLPTRSLHTLLN